MSTAIVIDSYEIQSIWQRKVSPSSRFDEIAARLFRVAHTLKKVIKNHYRKNERARGSFLELTEYYIAQLRENPGSNSFICIMRYGNRNE